VFVDSPNGGVGYSKEDRATSNGYVPISLQYGPYTAEFARERSMAAGDPVIDSTIINRSYKGKSVTASNVSDLKAILDTKAALNGKPVIVAINISKPMVFAEFEKQVDGIVGGFGVQDQAMMDLLTGAAEPSGLLPLQMPANMKTVEEQAEDVPHDMESHVDSEGHVYDFGFGLNWNGVINDARTVKYAKKATAQTKQSRP
jgi:beta-glucosidase